MLIDWFTIIAQLINFLILIWLLKRFLYKPILKVIDERETLITNQLLKAENIKNEAKKEKDVFEKKNNDFAKNKKDLLQKISLDVKAEYERQLIEIKDEIASFRKKELESFNQERSHIHQEIIIKTQREVFSITRKVLADLADMTLESRIVKSFIKRAYEMESVLKPINPSIENTAVIVKTAFELNKDQRGEIETAVDNVVGKKFQYKFEVEVSLFSGIEIVMGGNKLAWNIEDYLSKMEESVLGVAESNI